MTVLSSQNFDSFTENANITLSSPWGISGTAPKALAAAAVHGARGARYANMTTNVRIEYQFPAAIPSARVLSFYFVVRTMPTGGEVTFTSISDGASWNDNVELRNNGTVALIDDDGSTTAVSGVSLTTGVAYRCEWKLDPAGDTQELRMYTGEGTSPLFTLNDPAWTKSGSLYATFGAVPVADTSAALDFDTIKVADDWTGPEAPVSGGTPKLVVRRYNGSVWE